MLRSLYAGISGLRAEQTMLDVTSNNIANVNTVGFKSSAVHFEDTLSQTLQSAGLAQSYKAGTNPSQIGLGVRVADVATSLTQGSQQSTGSNLDTMVSGDGYFTTKIGSQSLYTRNGSFHFDAQGRLATAGGALVQGWLADSDGQVQTGLTPSNISISSNAVTKAKATDAATLAGNVPIDLTDATTDGFSRDIPVYGADGATKTLTVDFTPTGSGRQWSYTVYDAKDANGKPVGAVSGKLTFGDNGVLQSGTDNTKDLDGITVDFSKLTGFAGLNTTAITSQDGNPAGTLLSYTMGADGTLTGTFSNGKTVPLARLALATFSNPNGLEKSGSTSFTESINSGTAKFGVAGSDGYGAITAGALEASNVDLSQEFTNLIVAQRGFQANARIITTSDEILQELTQLKR